MFGARGLVGVWLLAVSCLCHALDVRADGPKVLVNEVRVHTFAVAAGAESAEQQAAAAASKIKAFQPGAAFTKSRLGKNWVVMMAGEVVLSISPLEAAAKRVSQQTLAATITQRLVDAVGLPALVSDRASLFLPPDRAATINLTGYAASKAEVTPTSNTIIKISRVGGQLLVQPLKTGSTQIQIKGGGTILQISVEVQPYALDAKAGFAAEVVGDPAEKSVVAGAVAASIQTSPAAERGVKVWARVMDPRPVRVGEYQTIKAKVHAVGDGYFAYTGEINVRVKNIGRGLKREDLLWYSNEPEDLTKPTRLYWASLNSGQSGRLLFHHKNDTPGPLVVRYLLANPSTLPAQVAVSIGEGKPNRNPTLAGYVAGDQYLSKWVTGSAEVVSIAPGSVVPISLRQLAPGETCSGLASIALAGTGASEIRVIGDCISPLSLYPEWGNGLNVSGAWHGAKQKQLSLTRINVEGDSKLVFPSPYREVRMDYEAGGRFGFARVGEEAIPDATNQKTLAGNFGVVYDIDGTLKNPTTAPVEVELLLEASAGYGSGLFIVNGDYVKLGLIQPKQEIVLASIKLPPGAVKPLKIQTMPLSGANYPVTLIVRPIGFELGSKR